MVCFPVVRKRRTCQSYARCCFRHILELGGGRYLPERCFRGRQDWCRTQSHPPPPMHPLPPPPLCRTSGLASFGEARRRRTTDDQAQEVAGRSTRGPPRYGRACCNIGPAACQPACCVPMASLVRGERPQDPPPLPAFATTQSMLPPQGCIGRGGGKPPPRSGRPAYA